MSTPRAAALVAALLVHCGGASPTTPSQDLGEGDPRDATVAPVDARDATLADRATPADAPADAPTLTDLTSPVDITTPPMDAATSPDARSPDATVAPDVAPDVTPAVAPSPVWTNRYDNARTGATLTETRLTAATVNASRFGLLFTRSVVGQIYAQPLYVPGVVIPGRGARNVVYVATEHDMVYAFDADDPALSTPYWSASVGTPMPSADIMKSGPCHNLVPEVGVTATPVIDLTTGTLYVLAKVREGAVYGHRLHALDITTGRPRAGSPVDVNAAVPGTGDGAGDDGLVHLEHQWSHARPGLALSGGVVYATFASHCDREVYHGWVLAYDAATLRPRGAFNTTPNGSNGGVWQSGTAPAVDERGDLYIAVGDGTATPGATTAPQLGNSVARLRLAGTAITAVDWFTPYNEADLFEHDLDLGSTGVMLLPRTHLALVGSKDGFLYLLDRDAMGHFHAGGDSQIVQSFRATHTGEARNLHGNPVYWDSPAGARIYVWAEEDLLKSFSFDGHLLSTAPVGVSSVRAGNGMPGGMLTLSANGSRAGTGVVWSSMPLALDAVDDTVAGVLRAFDAEDVSRELWNSEADPRDAVGMFAKFCPPTVANGRVYMATFSDRLAVYGLR